MRDADYGIEGRLLKELRDADSTFPTEFFSRPLLFHTKTRGTLTLDFNGIFPLKSKYQLKELYMLCIDTYSIYT
jgi:hypothetical protein